MVGKLTEVNWQASVEDTQADILERDPGVIM